MNTLNFHYGLSAEDVLHHPEIENRLCWMHDADVKTVWLSGYFYGHHVSSADELAKAKHILEERGFQVYVISVPLGHPGNSLNPDDPTLDLAIAKTWKYRIDKMGNPVYFCACANETMLSDNVQAAKLYAQIGFKRHFYDDDLRMGNWGNEIQGCFCPACLSEFNRQNGISINRATLAQICITSESMLPDDVKLIQRRWIQYNCDKITRFMRETAIPGMQNGIMIMHNGGVKHGISIPDIKEAVPDCMFRVGELHFNDATYCGPEGKYSLGESVRTHLRLISDNPAFSESTVFPAGALSPEHLIDKIKLEISLGLRNIFLMSGTWFLSEPYWKKLAQSEPELYDLAAKER